jgi:transcriptional regulator with XRE-family HTH domain
MSEQRDPGTPWQEISAKRYFDRRRQQLTTHTRALREQQGLSQQALADWLGCSRSRIARIENGKGGYALEELEFLALRLGQDPGRLTHPSPESETLMQIAFTNEWSHRALGGVVACSLPPGLLVPQAPHLALSPDNALVAASLQSQSGNEADRPEVIVLWDARTGAIKQRISLDGWASALAFSPDSRLLAIGTNMDTVKILDCASGRFRTYLDPVEDGYSEVLWAHVNEVGYGVISQVCFSPDGRYLAAVNEDHGTLRLWETGSWQAVTTWALNPLYNDEEEDEESPFGEFAVSQLAFTPDSRHLVIIPYLGRSETATLFTVPEGKRVQRLAFPEQIVSVGMASPFDPAGAIFAFGGHNHFWEAAYGEWGPGGRSWLTLYSSAARADDGFTRQTVRQVVVLSEQCILALIEKQGRNPRSEGHTGTLDVNDLPCWSVANLVSHQAAVLFDLGQAGIVSVTVRLADNGAALAFADSERQRIGVRSLQPEYLQTKAIHLPEGIRRRRRPAAESQAGLWYGEIGEESGPASVPHSLPDWEIGDIHSAIRPVQEDLNRMLRRLKTERPAAEGGYGLAQLAPGDQTTARRVVARIQVETDEKPLLIELPARGPEIRRRALIGYIIGRPLRQGEFTDEWARRLVVERPHTLIFIDNAERLHPEALLWLCTNLRTVTDAFVLVVHNWEKFIEVAGRNHDVAWVLGRSIPVDLVGLVE